MFRIATPALLALSILGGCSGSQTSPAPSASSSASAAPSTGPSQTAALPSGTPALASTPSPLPTPSPSTSPPPTGSAREIGLDVRLAPLSDGTLFVSYPVSGGSVVTHLGRSGTPVPGWPIVVRGATKCPLLLPVNDGSIRVACTLEDEGNISPPIGAFAFDSGGRLLAGWPVRLAGWAFTGGVVVGTTLTLGVVTALGDVIVEGQPSEAVGVETIAADGSLTTGVDTAGFPCCGAVSGVGPDGFGYGVGIVYKPVAASSVAAIDRLGARAGWPVTFGGIASGPAFGSNGRMYLAVAAPAPGTTKVSVLDPEARTVTAKSSELSIKTGVLPPNLDGAYECGPPIPKPPLVAGDGTIFVFSEIDDPVFSLGPSMAVLPGWPFRPPTPLERPNPMLGQDGITCPSLAIPAAGPDGTLYLPLQARNASAGGSLVAVGRDGRVRAGWPVELRRAGSEFWSVVAGSDGTVHALAIEPEAGGGSSATILDIAPDSTVLYATTIVNP